MTRSHHAAADLFGDLPVPSAMVPGLSSWDEVITPETEAALIERIDGCELTPFRFQGWLGKRLTHSFGWSYDFENGAFDQAEPIPGWLLPIRDIAAHTAALAPEALVQALLIRYDPGAGIGWHRDRPVFDHVVGLSLGNPATLRLRRRDGAKFARHAHRLAPRSLYRLSGEARYAWEHSIVEMTVPRWSVTFRTLRALGPGVG